MITLASIITITSKISSLVVTPIKDHVWPFLKENWKQVSWFALLLWAIICTLTHCSGTINPFGRRGGASDTTITRIDTAWVYPDTNKIFALKWKNMKPIHEQHIADSLRRVWKRPQRPNIPVGSNCRDSVALLLEHNRMMSLTLDECDDAYHDAIAIRTYGDTLRNDSIEVAVNFRVEGRIFGIPSVNYRYLAPYPVITVTETVTTTVEKGPYRKIYVEGGVGPDMTWNNTLSAVRGSLGVGYTDKKNWSYGIRAGANQFGYTVEAGVRMSFDIGKR